MFEGLQVAGEECAKRARLVGNCGRGAPVDLEPCQYHGNNVEIYPEKKELEDLVSYGIAIAREKLDYEPFNDAGVVSVIASKAIVPVRETLNSFNMLNRELEDEVVARRWEKGSGGISYTGKVCIHVLSLKCLPSSMSYAEV